MANRRPKPEEIVTKLRQVEVLVGQGMKRIDAIREIGVVEQTFYCSAPGSLDTSLSHAAGLIEIAVCHA